MAVEPGVTEFGEWLQVVTDSVVKAFLWILPPGASQARGLLAPSLELTEGLRISDLDWPTARGYFPKMTK